MAGIENIVVHSKSYLVRWIQVPEHHSISWSVQPHKKSIDFGIFKHPGHKNGLAPPVQTHETLDQPQTPVIPSTGADAPVQEGKRGHRGSVSSKHASQALVEKLQGIGLRSVAWTGKCEADKVSMGRYDVAEGEGGMYGLVFDNTFSKTTGKTITFVLMTHPTNAPPKSGHHLHYSQAFAPSAPGGRKVSSPALRPVPDSVESLNSDSTMHRGVLEDPRPKSNATESRGLEGATFYTGVLHKKRRKKGQGLARRFFSLDFTSATLSYYRDRHSSALRGAIPLSLAAIAVNEKAREFTVDSGAELWHLKASNRKDFDGWKDALERAAASANAASTPATPSNTFQSFIRSKQPDPAEQNEWARVEQLVSKVAGSRDAVRRLAKDTDPKYAPGASGLGLSHTTSNSSSTMPSPASHESVNDYFQEVSDERVQDKRPFWKRKPSTASATRAPSTLLRRTVSGHLAVSAPSPAPASPSVGSLNVSKSRQTASQQQLHQDEDVHDRCMALLRDLDEAVSGFSALIAESKARRLPPLPVSTSRMSMESTRSEEFFDAVDGTNTPSQFLTIRRSSEFDDTNEANAEEPVTYADSDASSTDGTAADESMYASASTGIILPKPKSLTPLPLPPTKRRNTLLPPKQAPPSIIGFLRKNAGKDLSTVSMPVTANEPTSLLQRLSECMEYSPLLDSAASASLPANERLLYVAAFAISGLAYNRVKERAIRKPFNPMLGETYELVREDLGFRFLAEKVSHHPVRAACQAESLNNGGWCFAQSPQPVQKFWGKSVELNTEGRSHVVLHAPNDGKGEHYSWGQATCFLRNVIAGEKYVEPVQSMTVVNESSGARAVATFKAGGMFAGRSEEVTVQLFDPAAGDAPISLGLAGKWTESLKRTDTGAEIWKAGALVPDTGKVYGFTTFAAALNEITENEDGFLPPTDSRLRPDQRLLEQGEVDKAESTKAKLEERQRSRKKVRDNHGQEWKPQFFEKMACDGEEMWKLKEKGGYWERRVKGDWSGVQEVFEA
ncbi:hypothetical protein WHR41_05124 [Cladosporium halotolerans]|uniref:PH domain-containing protein n=1 Tax=Cladosporium halotolerans TaxID=1052096 RepID=A0AB34KRX4_9PEZI